MTTATRGAFIVQLTTIIVPLMDAAVKRTPPSRLLLGACALAFGGVTAFVKSVPAGLATATTATGDGLIALSAVLYSLHVVRLSHHAPRIPPVALGRAKELTLH
jgi:drug/metabolite transporter (DMT)-like permease